MKLFPYGHATHPQWQMAAGLVLAQLRAQMASNQYASTPTLALLYITDHYASTAPEILAHLSGELPEVTDWSGTVGVGIASNNVEYFDEPALAVMLCELPADQYRVFCGVAPLGPGFEAHTALIHADGNTPDLTELIHEMALRTGSGYLFGGLSASRTQSVQFAVGGNGNIRGQGAASGVFSGGLSGVAFGEGVAMVSRVTSTVAVPVLPVEVVPRATSIFMPSRNCTVALKAPPETEAKTPFTLTATPVPAVPRTSTCERPVMRLLAGEVMVMGTGVLSMVNWTCFVVWLPSVSLITTESVTVPGVMAAVGVQVPPEELSWQSTTSGLPPMERRSEEVSTPLGSE